MLNTSLSLDENRADDGEGLSLISLITEDTTPALDDLAKKESAKNRERCLLSKLSKLEQEVYKLYMRQLHYDEIVEELKEIFPGKKLTKKTVDNALQRLRNKAHEMSRRIDFEDF